MMNKHTVSKFELAVSCSSRLGLQESRNLIEKLASMGFLVITNNELDTIKDHVNKLETYVVAMEKSSEPSLN